VRALLDQGRTREAAEEALRAIGPDVFRFLRARLRNETDAADAFSAFAEALLRGLAAFRGESALRTWALRIASHEAADVRTQAWRRHVRRLETTELSALAAEITTSVGRHEEERAGLERLRQTLKPRDDALLVLRVDQRLSWNEIAGVLSSGAGATTAAAVCKRFERLKQRLARKAEELGLLDDGLNR
jgi:RNA polymerase sigma-70 factor (ECF subfamily)